MIPEAHRALEALAPFDDSSIVLTPDEKIALDVVRKALDAVSRGEVWEPYDGTRMLSTRDLRRISVAYVHPTAPRPKVDGNEPLETPEGTP